MTTRAVLLNHDVSQLVAYCLDLRVEERRIVAVAQFPRKGEIERIDRVFERIQAGEIIGASVGAGFCSKNERQTARGLELGRWRIYEWSFGAPKNKAALITKIGGVETGMRWISAGGTPKTPRLPTMEDCGGDSAVLAAAVRRFEQMKRTAPWN
jgi:hypothetical protein